MKAKTKPGAALKLIPDQQGNLEHGKTFFVLQSGQEIELTGHVVDGHYEVVSYIWKGSVELIQRTCNEAGINIIKRFEGLKLESYLCPAQIWSIGYGTTRINGDRVTPGMRIIKTQAEKYLRDDLRRFEQWVSDRTDEIPLTDNQFSALVSLCYNCGMAPLDDENTIKEALNRQDYEAAAQGFMLWVYAGGKKLKGLVDRRREERELFEKKEL